MPGHLPWFSEATQAFCLSMRKRIVSHLGLWGQLLGDTSQLCGGATRNNRWFPVGLLLGLHRFGPVARAYTGELRTNRTFVSTDQRRDEAWGALPGLILHHSTSCVC